VHPVVSLGFKALGRISKTDRAKNPARDFAILRMLDPLKTSFSANSSLYIIFKALFESVRKASLAPSMYESKYEEGEKKRFTWC
jgi:hypothetical protein